MSTITVLLSTEVQEAVLDSASFIMIIWPDKAQEGFDTPLAAIYHTLRAQIDGNASLSIGKSRDEVAAQAGWMKSGHSYLLSESATRSAGIQHKYPTTSCIAWTTFWLYH